MIYGSTITCNIAHNGSGGIFSADTIYIDNLSTYLLKNNIPSNFAGNPYIPA
ncbi:MAG: hypothetical protein NKF70_00980 [Methanobacterium sp. ERen5]|nr:MAG: hypothetical protein NKF70_00980 [Methanobacterium sp. ERen5]